MTKSLIITCTNLGASHAANSAIYEILEAGLASSASLMVPCSWSREAASNDFLSKHDVGVQLTLNAECESYRWGPITQSPSLLDGNGGFPKTLNDLWDHADPDEVWRECRSQIERARLWGLHISHLGSHLDALFPRPEYFDIYLELSKEFNIPLRLAEKSQEAQYGFPFRELAESAGLTSPEKTFHLTGNSDVSIIVSEIESIENENYIAEITCAPILDTPEGRAIHPTNYADLIQIKERLQELKTQIATRDIQLRTWSALSLETQPKP